MKRMATIGVVTGFAIAGFPLGAAWGGVSLTISQESSPGAGDFDANILGTISAFATTATAAGYYDHTASPPFEFNPPTGEPSLTLDTATLFFVETADGLALFQVLDSPAGSGTASTTYSLSGDSATFLVQEDLPGGDFYSESPDGTLFTAQHQWFSGFTDGLAIGSLDGPWSMEVSFTAFTGLTDWVVVGPSGQQVSLTLELDRRLRVTAPHPLTKFAAPPVGVQEQMWLGSSCAASGGHAVAGAPGDDFGALNAGVVRVYDSTTGALLHTIANPDPDDGDVFGESVSISGSTLVVGASGDDIGSSSAGRAFVFDLSGGTPTQPVLTLENPDPANTDRFGFSVSVSGSRVLVGTHENDTGASNAGSAYVYDLSGPTPETPIHVIDNPDPQTNEFFGFSVAIDGDHAVVGAHWEGSDASMAGRAYVYDLAGGTPTVPVETLAHPSPAASDEMGTAVAVAGTIVAVGVPGDDTAANNAGSTLVFDLAGATPDVPIHTIDNPNPPLGGRFGRSLAMSGSSLLVGSTGGEAFLYDLAGGTPTVPEKVLEAPAPPAADDFGIAVAIDGSGTGLVGASMDDTIAKNAGSAYVYDLTATSPIAPGLTLNEAQPSSIDLFGFSVAVSGSKAVAGAPFVSAVAEYAGGAYVYDLAGATPTVPVHTLDTPELSASDEFGWAVAIEGSRAVVGAHLDSTAASNGGAAYVYDLAGASPADPVHTLRSPSPVAGGFFGRDVEISGDRVAVGAQDGAFVFDLSGATPTTPEFALNHSGTPNNEFGRAVAISGARALVGANREDTGANEAGSAYAYDLSGASPLDPAVTLNNPTPQSSDHFGWSVALSGSLAVVGAPSDNTGATSAGSVYVYDLAGASPTVPTVVLNNPSPEDFDHFGWSVAVSGNWIAVGAHLDEGVESDTGTIYLYDLLSPTPTVPVATCPNPDPMLDDEFGYSVSMSGTTVAIGAPRDNSPQGDKGAFYVFDSGPENVVEQPAETELVDGSSTVDFTGVPIGGTAVEKTFTVRNSGGLPLNGLMLTIDGANAADFPENTTAMSPTVAPSGSTTFIVSYSPSDGTSGPRTAALHVTSNDADENPFDIDLTGVALSTTADGDSDGLNDWGEYQLASLGFDWEVTQTALVTSLFDGANSAGLYTPSQVQALNVETPLIQRNPLTGEFTLTISVKKSTDLQNFALFPMSGPETLINGEGKLEFTFTVLDDAAFFRLLSE